MRLERTLYITSEFGLALSLIAVLAFAGCGGGGATIKSVLVQMGGGLQGASLSLTTAVSTIAGSGAPGAADNSVGTLATFWAPDGISTDGLNLYVADVNNHKIRKIVIASGQVSTLAGSGVPGSADNATGTLATFNFPRGITTDGRNLYVADTSNNMIRQVVISSGAVSTVAGNTTPGAVDLIGTSASFSAPHGITTDGTNLYVADYGNNKIRKILISSGAVTTLAGSGAAGSADNATGTSATFQHPYGITTDGINVYVTDYGNNKIRKIVIASGAVTTLAGSGLAGADDNVTGTLATFRGPDGITTDGFNLYVADTGNNTVRKIVIATGAVTTLAGSALAGGGATDNSMGTSATFSGPSGITTDGKSLYVTDANNNKVRRIQ